MRRPWTRLVAALAALVAGALYLRRRRGAPPVSAPATRSDAPTPAPSPEPPPRPARRTAAERWGALMVRWRWAVVAGWLAVLAACTLWLPTIREAQVGALGDLVPHDAEALEAEQRSAELFGFPLLSRTIVVQRDPQGLSAAAQGRAVRRAIDVTTGRWPILRSIRGAVPITNAFGQPPFSRERSTTALTFLFFRPDLGQVGRNSLAHVLVDAHIADGDAPIGVTGAIPARAAQARVISDKLPLVEIATVALVALTLGAYFRAPGPPLLGLLAVALAYLIALRAIAAVGKAVGVSVPSEVQPVIVVLLFGVLTDYTIFYVSRYRRRLRDGLAPRAAAAAACAQMTPTVVAAALAVVAAGSTLIAAQLGFLQAFGPGVAMSVLVGLAVAITFVPAAMAIAGAGLFWPLRVSQPVPASGSDVEDVAEQPRPVRGRRAVGLAVAHPVLTTLACVALLLGCASGLARLQPGNGLIRGLPADSEAVRAYRAASHGFTPGLLSPTMIMVERPGIVSERARLAALQRRLAASGGVAAVAGPASNPLPEALGATLSRTGDAARFVVVFRSDPLGADAIRRLGQLRDRLPGMLAAAGLGDATASIAGDTALAEETVDRTLGDGLRVLPLLLVALYIVLALFLRALVAPLLMLVASALVVAAALGLTVYVIQDLSWGEITYYVPFAATVLLVALGSDYTMFLAGRVWEAARTRPLREAIVEGSSRAATAIAVAGGLLAASFALLALVPLRPFRELAFVMAAGLVLDAFLVRPLLLPALLSLAGERSAWPSRRLTFTRRRGGAAPSPGAALEQLTTSG